jgi:hypothetical protein
MDKTDHLMAEKNKNNKDSQKGQVTPKKKYLKKKKIQIGGSKAVEGKVDWGKLTKVRLV